MSEWTVAPGAGAAASEPWQVLYRYWLSKHIDGRPPARGDLDPITEIPRLVANLMILEALPDGYEYRLVGSEVAALSGLDMTNKRSGTSPKYFAVIAEWMAALEAVKLNREPRLLYSTLTGQFVATNIVLLLPLHAEPGENMKILGALFRQGAFDPNLRVENLSVKEIPV